MISEVAGFIRSWTWWTIYDPESGDIVRMGTQEAPPPTAQASFPGWPNRTRTVANGREYDIGRLRIWTTPFDLIFQVSRLTPQAAYDALMSFHKNIAKIKVVEEDGKRRFEQKDAREIAAQSDRVILCSAKDQMIDLVQQRRDIRTAIDEGVPSRVYADDLDRIEEEMRKLRDILGANGDRSV